MEIITVIGLTFGRFFTGIPIIETNIIKLDIHELFEVQYGDEHYVNIKIGNEDNKLQQGN